MLCCGVFIPGVQVLSIPKIDGSESPQTINCPGFGKGFQGYTATVEASRAVPRMILPIPKGHLHRVPPFQQYQVEIAFLWEYAFQVMQTHDGQGNKFLKSSRCSNTKSVYLVVPVTGAARFAKNGREGDEVSGVSGNWPLYEECWKVIKHILATTARQ